MDRFADPEEVAADGLEIDLQAHAGWIRGGSPGFRQGDAWGRKQFRNSWRKANLTLNLDRASHCTSDVPRSHLFSESRIMRSLSSLFVLVGIASYSPSVLAAETHKGEDLSNRSFSGKDLTNAEFKNCTLDGARFNQTIGAKASFEGSSGKGINFSAMQVSDADFRETRFPQADFRNTDLRNASFKKAALETVNFQNAVLLD